MENEKIRLREKLGYGSGDLAYSTVFNFTAAYMTYFYTDVAGLTVAAAAAILTAARLIDAIVNPVVGIGMDRVRTPMGRARPFIRYTALPLALCTFLMFTVSYAPERFRGILAAVTYVAYLVLYTLSNLPYSALMPNMTADQTERASLNQFRFFAISGAQLISSVVAIRLVTVFGGGDEKKGYLCLSVCFAAMIIVLLTVCFRSVKERIITDPAPLNKETVRATLKNGKPWIAVCIGGLFYFIANTTRNSVVVYYAKYVLNDSSLSAILIFLIMPANLLMSFVVPRLAARFPKKRISQVSMAEFAVCTAAIWFCGNNFIAIAILTFLGSVGYSACNNCSYLLLSDTIDYSEYKTGVRQQGLITAMFMFSIKSGILLSSVLVAVLLGAGGYVADAVQSSAAVLAFRLGISVIPAVLGLGTVLILCLYDLDGKRDAVCAELAKRRAK